MERVYRGRIERVSQRVAEAGVDALLVTHLANVLYLCGFSGSAAALLIEPDRLTLFTDGRYTLQSREEAPGVRVCICKGPLLAGVGERLRPRKRMRIGFEPARLSVAQMRALRQAAGAGIRWQGMENTVEELRSIKDATELAQIRQAARVGCEVFEEVLRLVRPGVSELELAGEIEYRMRQKGAQGAAFETIVASGPRTALPHARPMAKRLRKNELVVIDLGAILGDYCCDLTRTVYVGRAPSRVRRWHQAVREAQAAAREALRVGVAASEVHAAAKGVLRGFRLDRYFVHSTGHGLGLEVHELPRLARGEKRRIQAGNVVTLEPGVYVEGIGGIRVEDDVAVFTDGTEVLTPAPRKLLEL